MPERVEKEREKQEMRNRKTRNMSALNSFEEETSSKEGDKAGNVERD